MTARYVYFIRPVGAVGPVKIGVSARPEQRIQELLEWSPVDLEIAYLMPGSHKLESELHNALANDHLRREWFKATPRVVEIVEGLRAGKDISDLIDLSIKEGSLHPKKSARAPRRSRKTPITGTIGLTEGQRDCLVFLKVYFAEHERFPTYREIMAGLRLHSTSGVARLIEGLEERGYVNRARGRWNCLSLVDQSEMARAA